ncbi:MAG TPA: AfsR/SARP family transcriptional regulator [Gaiellaceae bacterium]|nr:AfsR/SARP family transcriptional regulator [Gaiellaceae bacterium]
MTWSQTVVPSEPAAALCKPAARNAAQHARTTNTCFVISASFRMALSFPGRFVTGHRSSSAGLPLGYRATTVSAVLRYGILGPVEASGEDGAVRLGAPRQRATLALLLLNANSVVSIERLADSLYAGRPPVTAVTQVHRHVSELRKALGAEAIETQGSGYMMRVGPQELDLTRFERACVDASDRLARGDADRAAGMFRDALALWRGAPLVELADNPAAAPQIRRLEELRLAAHERLLEAELALGRHGEVIGSLEQLVAENPLRESLRRLQILALYRAGRQSEALEVFRQVRSELVESFGLEPSSTLRELELAILRQDPTLELPATPGRSPDLTRAVLVSASDDAALGRLLPLAEPLTASQELIVARLVETENELGAAAATTNARCGLLGRSVRVAVFTSTEPPEDSARLADSHDVHLVLVDAPPGIEGDRVPSDLRALFERSPADVGVVVGEPGVDGDLFVQFGGGEHDWAALELGALLAAASGMPLTLVGTRADSGTGRRDASRLLAHAGLAAQRVAGVETRPLLADPSSAGLVRAIVGARAVVAGVSESWQRSGVGETRRALLGAGVCVVLVHRGPRPGLLAPRDDLTRFTWTLDYLQADSLRPT